MSTTELKKEVITLDPLMAAVQSDAAGAIATFLGVVRDHNAGMPITLLEYHAYESMAEAELGRVADEIEAEIAGVKVACAHRIGELRVGDTAVACVASAAHRGEAFRACRLLIDRIKERVPIFKREHGPDGPYWVGWQDARSVPNRA